MRTQLTGTAAQEYFKSICSWYNGSLDPHAQIINCYHSIAIITDVYRDDKITETDYQTLMKTIIYLYFQPQPEDLAQKEIRKTATRYFIYHEPNAYYREYEIETRRANRLKSENFDSWILVDQFIEELYSDKDKER